MCKCPKLNCYLVTIVLLFKSFFSISFRLRGHLEYFLKKGRKENYIKHTLLSLKLNFVSLYKFLYDINRQNLPMIKFSSSSKKKNTENCMHVSIKLKEVFLIKSITFLNGDNSSNKKTKFVTYCNKDNSR